MFCGEALANVRASFLFMGVLSFWGEGGNCWLNLLVVWIWVIIVWRAIMERFYVG